MKNGLNMKKSQVFFLILFIPYVCLSQQKNINENLIYSMVLKEYFHQHSESKRIQIIVFNKNEKKLNLNTELMNESLGNEDLGMLWAVSPDLINMIGSIGYIDTTLIDLINKFERDSIVRKIDFYEFDLPYEVIEISGREIKRRFKKDIGKGWAKFYEDYPKSFGIVELSNLTISDDGRYCLFYVGYQKSGLNGYGCLLFVDLKEGMKIKKEIALWIS